MSVVLAELLRANLALSAAILVVLALRRATRARFGAAAAYVLWLLAPLCLLASLVPAERGPRVLAPVMLQVAGAASSLPAGLLRAKGDPDLMVAVWLTGSAVGVALLAARQARFVRRLGPLTPDGGAGRLRAGRRGGGPFVLGWLRPRIVTPADFEQRFTPQAQRLVLAHEQVHLERGDAAVNGVVALVQCLAWFNPLVHLAARRLRIDQEVACDAAVTAARPESRRLYAQTLLDAALAPVRPPFGCQWPAAGAHALKERLAMLQLVPVSPARRKLGLVLAGAIALAGAGAVWAADPAAPRLVGKPDWAQTPTGADLAGFYPRAAEKAHKEGLAVITCRVREDGGLRACKVKRQDPARYGFGEAALKMSPRFRMKAKDQDGRATAGAVVTIPIKFALHG